VRGVLKMATQKPDSRGFTKPDSMDQAAQPENKAKEQGSRLNKERLLFVAAGCGVCATLLDSGKGQK
jgi:Flp pilus assembly protein TadB